jgi:transcriptional regulator with XRE-family HTH domain
MDAADLIDLRTTLNISQITMASRMGLSLRAFRNIENGKVRLRRVHELAIERVLIDYAIARNDPELLGDLQVRLTNMIMFDFSVRAGAGIAAVDNYRSKRFDLVDRASGVRNSSMLSKNTRAQSDLEA